MVRPCCTPNIWFFVNSICVLAVVTQLAFNFRDFVFPRLTNTRVETRSIHEEPFPLIFKFCIKPAFNKAALEETGYGYGGVYKYFQGRSNFNKSIYGWAGHTNDSGTYATVQEVYQKVSSYAPEDVIQKITLTFKESPGFSLNHSHVDLAIQYPFNCLRLNLSKIPEIGNKKLLYLTFSFYGKKNITSVQVIPYGRHLIGPRDFFHYYLYSTGDAIISEEGHLKRYAVEISENIYVEEDKDKHCREYPNEEYESFGDCDHEYLKMICKKHDIYPVWLNNDFTNTTTRFVLSEEEQSRLKATRTSKRRLLGDKKPIAYQNSRRTGHLCLKLSHFSVINFYINFVW